MSNISSIIEIYRMTELPPSVRASIMGKLGKAINDEFSMNLCEEIVAELVKTLPVNRDDVPELAEWLGDRWKGFQGF